MTLVGCSTWMDLVDINKRFCDWNLPKFCPCRYTGCACLCSEMRRFQKKSSRIWVVKTHQKFTMKPDSRFRISVSTNRILREPESFFGCLFVIQVVHAYAPRWGGFSKIPPGFGWSRHIKKSLRSPISGSGAQFLVIVILLRQNFRKFEQWSNLRQLGDRVDGSMKFNASQGIRMVAADRFPPDRTLSEV